MAQQILMTFGIRLKEENIYGQRGVQVSGFAPINKGGGWGVRETPQEVTPDASCSLVGNQFYGSGKESPPLPNGWEVGY